MTYEKSLAALRKKIDSIDSDILVLLNRRAMIAQKVAKTKIAKGEDACFYRAEREVEVLRRMKESNEGPLSHQFIVRFYQELMSACLALQKPIKVAFLGPEGTFTQQAAYKHFGHSIEVSPLPAIDEIFRSVESGSADFGVVPVENSSEGVITHTLDSFLNSRLLICGEVALRIHHNLLSNLSELSEIKEVYSHQQSLAQCREWLNRFLPNAKRTSVSSNAEAARLVANMPHSAAIASEVAAGLYKLNIIENNIEDEPDNTTRFLVIGKQGVSNTGSDKTSLLVSTGNQSGALYRILEPFDHYGISMTKIESRPSRRGTWDYVFFIDIEGHREQPKVIQALELLQKSASIFKVLGSYPRAIL